MNARHFGLGGSRPLSVMAERFHLGVHRAAL